MDGTKNTLALPLTLDLHNIKPNLSLNHHKYITPNYAKLDKEDLPFQTKSTPRTNPTSTQDDVLDLDAIMANYDQLSRKSEDSKLDEIAQKTIQLDLSFKSLNQNVNNKNRDYDNSQREIKIQTQSDIFNNSDLMGSSHLSSYIFDSNKTSQHKDIFSQSNNNDLQSLIDQAEAYSNIKLPSAIIKVKKLVINKPLTLQGTCGATLEVSDSIVVNLNGYSGNDNKVTISECTIYFEYQVNKDRMNLSTASKIGSKFFEDVKGINKKSFLDQTQLQSILEARKNDSVPTTSDTRIYPLFRVGCRGVLEVRDSNITSKNKALGINDVCFYLDSQNQSENDMTELLPTPTVYAQSTFINGFSTAFQNNMQGKFYIEKLYINNTQNHALNISNPYVLEVKECTIENTGKSCVNLRFSLEFNQSLQRRVLIEKNKFSKGENYGISIFGENLKPQLCDINILENTITYFEKDGVCIKNLNVNQIKFEKNQVLNNSRNGVSIQNVIDLVSFQQVRLIQNKIAQSHLYGLVITDSLCFSEKDQICQNGKAGVLLKGNVKPLTREEITFSKNCPLRNIFSFANIYYNKESGITVYGYLKGPVILNSCGIHENSNGVYIKQEALESRETFSSPNASQSTMNNVDKATMDVLNDIVMDKCAIFQNELSGIHIKGIAMKAYLKETLIYENRNYAIFIQNEGEKDRVVFRDGDKSKIKQNISGYVGGSWGVLFEQNSNVCKRVTCNIF